ncbi:MAG: putative lipoprotein, partial [Acidobacteriaceae bacterium]|nr:putative lipoprotein [Acidobacteriaceae bacterium]
FAAIFFSISVLAQKVTTDYDHSANFSQYHTYSWGVVHATDPLFEDRIRQAVDRALQAKGWQMVPSGGDATVTAVAAKQEKTEYTTFYDGLGPGWGWRGWGDGMATTSVDNIPVGSLVIDIYDSSTRHLLWRGVATDQLSNKPEKNTQKLDKAVSKLFEHFPPKSS